MLNVVSSCSAFFPQHWLHTGSGASAVCPLQQWTEESTRPCQPNARQAAGQPAGLQWAGTHGAGGKHPAHGSHADTERGPESDTGSSL